MQTAISQSAITVFTALSLFILSGCEKEDHAKCDKLVASNNSTQKGSSITTSAFGTCDYDLAEATLTSTGWTKIFDENFTDLSKWNVWYGGAYNNELQLYQAPNLQLSGGNLLINAVKETKVGSTLPGSTTNSSFDFTSGRIESKTLFSAAKNNPKIRMVARLKLPAGYGMWPAFWSYGDPWPTQGEIDIMEARGQEPFNYSTAYWYGRAPGKNLVQNSSVTITSSADLQTCWHVYEMIWSQNSLTYLLDGLVVDTKTGGYISKMFGKQQKLTLNLAVGGGFFQNLNPALIQPGTLQVDWVKVFRSN
jgi:beta-glucanase (GH16 family)